MSEVVMHELKLLSYYADSVLNGEKQFEIRYNDRNYKVGDYIKFKVISIGADGKIVFIDHKLNSVTYQINYILPENSIGLKEGFVILNIKPVN